ncbi:MAG: VWD domain-containing protein [Thermostichus sp. DG02_5_bins_236]
MQALLGLILIFLLVVLSSCGAAPNSVAVTPSETIPARVGRADSSEPQEIVLVEPTLLFSETCPLNSENYWVAWQDPNLGYVVASQVGIPVTVPNYPPTEGRIGRAIVVEPVPQVFSPTGIPLTEGASCSVPTPTPTPGPTLPIKPPGECTSDRCQRAGSFRDPHFGTFDGLAYDFQASGDFVLTRSIDGRFEIQARHTPVTLYPDVSLNTAISARLGEQIVRLTIGAGEELEVFINGSPTQIEPGELRVFEDGSQLFRSAGTLAAQGRDSYILA